MAGNDHVAHEVLKWKCPVCGKEIISLYPKQFDYLKKQHNLKHEGASNSEKPTMEGT